MDINFNYDLTEEQFNRLEKAIEDKFDKAIISLENEMGKIRCQMERLKEDIEEIEDTLEKYHITNDGIRST